MQPASQRESRILAEQGQGQGHGVLIAGLEDLPIVIS
jgi:hypothetical protein